MNKLKSGWFWCIEFDGYVSIRAFFVGAFCSRAKQCHLVSVFILAYGYFDLLDVEFA